MITRLQAWLASLADPAGPRLRFDPRPFSVDDSARFDRLLHELARHNVHLAGFANLVALLSSDPGAVFAAERSAVFATAELAIGELRARRLTEVAHNALLAEAAREIRRAIAGIDAVVIKGLDFAENAYGGVERRKFSDVDILVDAGAEVTVGEVLAGLGFSPVEPKGRKIAQTERKWLGTSLSREPVLVEVHTNLVHDPSTRRSISLTFAQHAGKTGPDANAARLVAAAIHGATSHLFGRLQYVVDGMMIARAGVDPRDARDRGVATGSLLMIATMLRLAHTIFECEQSAALLEAIGPVRGHGTGQLLIPPSVVLSAKGTHRWRHLPRRRLYALAMRHFASRQYVLKQGLEQQPVL